MCYAENEELKNIPRHVNVDGINVILTHHYGQECRWCGEIGHDVQDPNICTKLRENARFREEKRKTAKRKANENRA